VRSNSHIPIYHANLRIHHFAPAAAYLLLQQKDIRATVDRVVEPLLDGVDFLDKEVRKRL
jgi:hypothetical protein